MASNLAVPGTDPNSLSGQSCKIEQDSSASDDVGRLRTGKRGRPPLDPSQKGLAERRRNQVRKAQRAYRSRKQEEDAFRTNYVQVLENRIRHMRWSFFELASLVKKAEITQRQPDLTHELESITQDFVSASQIIEPFNDSQRDDGHAYSTHSGGIPDSSTPVIFPNISISCSTEHPVPATAPIGTAVPNLVPAQGIAPTFSETEIPLPKNFAQRLYFSCIQRAHSLLTNPHADGAEVARVFQYSFHYSDANTMISTFDILLRTNADYRTAYVYRFGGAGTHYKSRKADLDIVQNVSLGQETPSKSNDETWFDPRDIDGWLAENGLVIGGSQSFMYLSEFRSFEPSRNMTLYPEAEVPVFSQRDVGQSAKVLNVDLFLQELLSRGVCLGCAPGFRRLDVEAAFNLAIFDDTTFICEP